MTRTCDEFICRSCGRLIYSFPRAERAPVQCAVCAWLDEWIADPAKREKLRRHLCDCDDSYQELTDCETSKPERAG